MPAKKKIAGKKPTKVSKAAKTGSAAASRSRKARQAKQATGLTGAATDGSDESAIVALRATVGNLQELHRWQGRLLQEMAIRLNELS